MPWKETTPVAERMQSLVDYRSGLFTVSFLAERHGVSRKTLYKWIERFVAEGAAGSRTAYDGRTGTRIKPPEMSSRP